MDKDTPGEDVKSNSLNFKIAKNWLFLKLCNLNSDEIYKKCSVTYNATKKNETFFIYLNVFVCLLLSQFLFLQF